MQHPEWASTRCNIRNGHLQGATTKMEQRVAQHCLQQSSTSRYGIDIVNSKFDQKIWNNKFDQKIWIQHWHRHRHRDHQDGQEEQQPSSTLKGHVHNNLADIITSMVESECTTSGQHSLKPFCVSSTSTSGACNSTSCLVDVHSIVPSKGVTTTRCIATSTTAVQRQDATTSVANHCHHCHQQHWYKKNSLSSRSSSSTTSTTSTTSSSSTGAVFSVNSQQFSRRRLQRQEFIRNNQFNK